MSSLLLVGRARQLSRMSAVLALSASAVFGTSVTQASADTQLTINTPSNAVVCQPQLLTWSGGQAPYELTVQPGADPNGQPLRDLGQQDGTQYNWTVDIAAGTQVGLTLRDSTGTVAQSAPFTINPGPDNSCVRT
ncbi:hypothetical protein ABZ471_39925 [Streptomyces sp. NPDC005728]|uniref:hypothetical protein n=1 Tax=Streptomyces sp. NPDC005728 TaxID=3157054 RepID=UPI0033DD95F0